MSVTALASALFCVGLYGVLTRREIVAVLACVEIMLGAANLQLVALSGFSAGLEASAGAPQGIALVVLVVAAAEAAVGLALLVAIVRRRRVTRMDELMEVEG